jgi:NAD(P)-dependent dehydrogenase (short-subunit alcohol dehydrogenase family)
MSKAMEEKSERVAIVTGAGSGLGRAMAKAFVDHGTRCVLAGRRLHALEETVAIISGDRSKLLLVQSDVTVAADRAKIVSECLATFGRVDILVNNAGISFIAPLLAHEEKEWRQVMNTNLDSHFFMAKEVIPFMRDQHWGRIINIASIYGSLASNNDLYGDLMPAANEQGLGPTRQPGYHTSKGGVLTLTIDLAVAVARWGITVNAISPGMFMTEQTGHIVNDQVEKNVETMTPMGRFGKPHEVAHAVRFLASEDASFITGINLRVDGGWSLW